MLELSSALKKKGYLITISSDSDKIETVDKDTDLVIRSADVENGHPEVEAARKNGIEVISFTEFIARQTKNKTRVVIRENRVGGQILPIVCFVLRKKNILYDVASVNAIYGEEQHIQLSYDARIALLDGERELNAPMGDKIPSGYLYNPHILVMPRFQWIKDKPFETPDLYLNFHKKLIASIERDGKFIFNETYPALQMLGDSVREDVTALSYKIPQIQVNPTDTEVETRYGKITVNTTDENDIADIFAAELVCKQLGVKSSDFFSLLGEYRFK